jgi:hypothetical protein
MLHLVLYHATFTHLQFRALFGLTEAVRKFIAISSTLIADTGANYTYSYHYVNGNGASVTDRCFNQQSIYQ